MNFSPQDIQRNVGGTLNGTLIGGLMVQAYNVQANANKLSLLFYADGGSYNLTFREAQNTSSGIIECYVDGVLHDSFDAYATPGGTIRTFTLPAVVLATGNHAVDFVVNGKNAASTDFGMYLAWASIVPV